jgi:DNA-binding FadR family transcriptional regulator
MADAPVGSKRSKKLSEIVAAKLMEEIRSRNWPVGESLGTEAELMTRYSVSRATVAEAVRQVERYGAAEMRRGSGGGLVIMNSARFALAKTLSTYLELSNISIVEQYEASRLIEMEAARLAAEQVNEEQIAQLRLAVRQLATIDDNIELHRAAMQLRIKIAEFCGSRPVLLFMRSLARVLTHYVRPDLRTQFRDLAFEHGLTADLTGIVEAIVAGEPDLAASTVRRDIERREYRARELAVAQPLLASGPLRREAPNKLAEKVAYAIRDDIARTGWQVGARLGDEAELPERYEVSQWVLRQAIRILETSGIVTMRRGQGGGLYISRPSPDHTIETAVSYLNAYQETHAIPIDDYLNLRRTLYRNMAQMAAKRSTQSERNELVELAKQLAASNEDGIAGDLFWLQLGKMGRNQVLALFGTLVSRFISENSKADLSLDAELLIAVAEAIREGDAALAQRRMDKVAAVQN